MSPSARLVLVVACLLAPCALAEGDATSPWSNKLEFSFVLTSGNADTLSLGLEHELRGKWDKQEFRMKLRALRAEDTREHRIALGSLDDFTIDSRKDSQLTAESYEVDLRYDRRLGARNAWFVEGSWYRNEFSGIRDRLTGAGGLATTWKDAERLHFRTDVGLTWTKQGDLVEPPSRDNTWLGLRFGWELRAKVGRGGEYGNEAKADFSFAQSDDVRLVMTNWFSAAITEHLALKISHRILWDGDPSLEEVDLFDPGDPTTPLDKVQVALDELDTVLDASVVLRW